jgi:DNA polymerase IV
MAVGGSAESGGVLTTANYVARRFGVRSAMATFVALKLCPSLVLLPVNFDKYRRFSGIVQDVFREYDKNVM